MYSPIPNFLSLAANALALGFSRSCLSYTSGLKSYQAETTTEHAVHVKAERKPGLTEEESAVKLVTLPETE